jgi:hypothetical protein
MPSPYYLAACILLPAVWGVTVALVYQFIASKHKELKQDREVEEAPRTGEEI